MQAARPRWACRGWSVRAESGRQAKPLVKNVTQWDDYPGRLSAVETVEVRSQVSGFVQSVSFTEGAMVKKGDLLLTIDTRIFDAQLENAKAELLQGQAKLEQAQASLQLSQNDYKRAQQVAVGGGITAEELDTRRANVAQAEANVSVAKATIAAGEAKINEANLNVDWCRITAPISGQISDRQITPGNMLIGGALGTSTTRVTTIKSVDPMYCYVDVDEAAVLRYQKLAREQKRVSAEQEQIPCYVQLGNETAFPHTGVIDFVDNRIDPTTSTRRARGVFRNPDGIFTDGNYAVLRVAGEELKDATLVIDDAIGTDQDKRYLWILKPDNSLERRTVTVGPREGELRVVRTNLRPDETVIVNGLSSLMQVPPGGKVDPTITEMPLHRLAAAAGPATAASTAATGAATATAACGNGDRGREMNFARFFIDRPVLAIVISIVIVIAGVISIPNLPISQYPEIVPPTVIVSASYPGANAQTIADTVAAPIEQQVNGVEGLLYLSSNSVDGAYNLTATFKLGTNLDTAQVQVQNRVAIAQPQLPSDVQRIGVTVKKASPDITLAIRLYSPHESYDRLYLSNYALLQLREQLARLPGVGDIRIFGARDYSMRVWLDPQKIASLNLTATDVVNAIREQNVQVAAGVVGAQPLPIGGVELSAYDLGGGASGHQGAV